LKGKGHGGYGPAGGEAGAAVRAGHRDGWEALHIFILMMWDIILI